MKVIGLSGTQYQLDSNLIGDGGEGKIYKVLGTDKVAKIYKDSVSGELVEKLKYMVNNKPNSSVLNQVAWPLDIIYECSTQKFLGFIMPLLNFNAELGEIYAYPSKSNISSHYKILVAENICAVISAVHEAGYVFGDFNPRNIRVNKNTGEVAFLDTDSYHIVIGDKAYRCNVCAQGYAAPELIEKCSGKNYADAPLPTFTKETDNFALAIHIFKLLLNGFSPFGGIPDKQSPSVASPGKGNDAVRRNSYCFKPGFKHLSAAIPPLDSFPKNISDLLTRAFIRGKSDPKQRPSALEWHEVLVAYEKNLVTCANNPLHQYYKKNDNCPLCKADEKYKGIPAKPSIPQKKYANVVRPPVKAPKRNLLIRRNIAIASVSICVLALGFVFFSNNNESKEYKTKTVKEYKSIKIGSQIWMAENLNIDASASKCYNNNLANCARYGRLYDWNTAMKICPSGWHLPSKAEWDKLSVGIYSPEFAALPGGYGYADGSFRNALIGSYWWSASESSAGKAYNRFMRSKEKFGWDGDNKSALFSVRCVRNL